MSVYKQGIVRQKSLDNGVDNIIRLITLLNKLLGWRQLDPIMSVFEYKLPSGKIIRFSVLYMYQYSSYQATKVLIA